MFDLFIDRVPGDNGPAHNLAKRLYKECKKIAEKIKELKQQDKQLCETGLISDAERELHSNITLEICELTRVYALMYRYVNQFLLHKIDPDEIKYFVQLARINSLNPEKTLRIAGGEQ